MSRLNPLLLLEVSSSQRFFTPTNKVCNTRYTVFIPKVCSLVRLIRTYNLTHVYVVNYNIYDPLICMLARFQL